VVAEKRGRSYVVEVAGTKTPRIIIARPEHIGPVVESSGWQGRVYKGK